MIHQEQTIGQKKALKQAQERFEYAKNSPLREKYLQKLKICRKFYYGKQWESSFNSIDLAEMRQQIIDIGAIPLTVNRIEPKIDSYLNLHITNKKKIGINATTTLKKHKIEADNLKNFFLNLSTQLDMEFKDNEIVKDLNISGIGFRKFEYNNNAQYPLSYKHLLSEWVYVDPDDNSRQYDNSDFICYAPFLSIIKLKQMFPQHAELFDSMVDAENIIGNGNNDLTNSELAINDYDNSWVRGRTIRIVEVYYKKNAKYYQGTSMIEPDDNDTESYNEDENLDDIATEITFQTFYKELAEKKNTAGNDLQVLDGTQIWKAVYCDQTLLENAPINGQTPNQRYFPIQAICYDRDDEGVPRGKVEGIIDLAITYNFAFSKTVHGLDTRHIITSDTDIDINKGREMMKKEMRSRNGVIFSKNPKDMQFINSEGMLPYYFNFLSRLDLDLDFLTQVHSDYEGEKTNASSGVAIQTRTQNTARNLVQLQYTYNYMLISLGRLMLDTIRGIKDLKYTFNYLKGNKINYSVLTDEISTMAFEIYPEITPNYASSNDELSDKFQEIINSPNPDAMLISPEFMEAKGITHSHAEELYQAYIKSQIKKAELTKAQQDILQPQMPEAPPKEQGLNQ